MDFIINSLVGLVVYLISTISSRVLCPLIVFASWYLIYTSGAIFLKILFKLRYEVYNQDLKYKREERKDRLIVITGATSGIGLASALHFYRRGFAVVACYYSRDEPGYNELNDISNTKSATHAGSLHLVKLDVKSTESIEDCFRFVESVMSSNPKLKLHALLNVAGVGYYYKFQWMPRQMIKNTVETNLLGPMLMTRQFLPLLIKCPDSRVVNIASPLGLFATDYNSVYGPTKAGLTQFSDTLEIDLAHYGVRTTTIHPGYLIRHTAVLKSSCEMKLDKVVPELKDYEMKLYKEELDRHLTRMNRLDIALRKPVNLELSWKSSIRANIVKLGLIVSGAVQETKLHESSSFMRSFDNSISLRFPPKEMFAGNIFFTLIAGSAIEVASRAICRDIHFTLRRGILGHMF